MSNPREVFQRPRGAELARRLAEPRRFIQVLAGARQVGKTTLVQQVDFIVCDGHAITAIEVKSGRARRSRPGLASFAAKFQPARKLLVGGDGIPVEEFLTGPITHWIAR